jgi:hypothetical protein
MGLCTSLVSPAYRKDATADGLIVRFALEFGPLSVAGLSGLSPFAVFVTSGPSVPHLPIPTTSQNFPTTRAAYGRRGHDLDDVDGRNCNPRVDLEKAIGQSGSGFED